MLGRTEEHFEGQKLKILKLSIKLFQLNWFMDAISRNTQHPHSAEYNIVLYMIHLIKDIYRNTYIINSW